MEQVRNLTGTDKPPATAIVDKGHRGVEIEGAHPALRPEAGPHEDAQDHDQEAQRHRAGYRAHEDGRAAEPQRAQRRAGRCAARGDVWRGALPTADHGRAEASMRPIRLSIQAAITAPLAVLGGRRPVCG